MQDNLACVQFLYTKYEIQNRIFFSKDKCYQSFQMNNKLCNFTFDIYVSSQELFIELLKYFFCLSALNEIKQFLYWKKLNVSNILVHNFYFVNKRAPCFVSNPGLGFTKNLMTKIYFKYTELFIT